MNLRWCGLHVRIQFHPLFWLNYSKSQAVLAHESHLPQRPARTARSPLTQKLKFHASQNRAVELSEHVGGHQNPSRVPRDIPETAPSQNGICDPGEAKECGTSHTRPANGSERVSTILDRTFRPSISEEKYRNQLVRIASHHECESWLLASDQF